MTHDVTSGVTLRKPPQFDIRHMECSTCDKAIR
jgi:hypothetical protein